MSNMSVKSSARSRCFSISTFSKIAACLMLLLCLPKVWAVSTTVVISQVYAAGGNSKATYNADYVELYNLSSTTQSLDGFAIQYISSATTSTSVVTMALPAGVSLAPGQHYLIEGTTACNASTPTCADLPTADFSTSKLAAGANAGRVYLTSDATPLAGGSCAITSSVVDYVGYGATGCYEGTGPGPAPDTTHADLRTTPCTDTDDNSVDFSLITVGSPLPSNSSDAPVSCGGGSAGLGATGKATPSSVYQGATTTLAVTVGPATGSTNIVVTADLSAIGGSSTTPLHDDGMNGDATANDHIYSYTLNVPSGQTTGATTIVATASDDEAHSTTANISLTVLAKLAPIAIHTILGATPWLPNSYTGQVVMTSGIVTGVKANGFFIQAKDSDIDGDPATPEGIFVHSSTIPTEAVIGNELQVTGTVSQYPTGVLRPGTELDTPTEPTVLTSANQLPAAIVLTTTNPSSTGDVYQLMRYESMRLSVPSFTVTGPTSGALDEVNETYTSTGQFWGTVTGVPRPVREPGLEVLDPFTVGQPNTIPRFDDNPELFQVDSLEMTSSPGPLDLSTGTVLTNLTGVMDFSNAPLASAPMPGGMPMLAIDAKSRPTVSGGMTLTPVDPAMPGELTIGDQNLERFYNAVKDTTGAVVVTQTAFNLRLAKASLEIRNVMRTPDILAVEEMENLDTLTALSAQISTDAAAASQTDPHYVPYLVQGNDTSGINNGFLINPSKVTVVSVDQFGKDTTFTQPSTGNQAELNDRPPLVLHATIPLGGSNSYPLTVIVNHLKSLDNANLDTGSGQNTRAKREQQAEFLANLVQGYQSNGEHVIVVGDLNTFEFSDGLVDSFGILKGAVTPADQVVVPGPTTSLVTPNLVDIAPTDLSQNAYTYDFNGNAQSIDHFLVTADIAGIIRTEPVHVNADFPDTTRNDITTPLGGSDHDGIVGYLKVPGSTTLTFDPTSLSFDTQPLNATATKTITVTNTGTNPITITSIVGSGVFSVPSNTCGTSLDGNNATCIITVGFTPTVAGPTTGTITLTDSDVSGTQTISVTGTGAGVFSTTTLSPLSTSTIFGDAVTLTATVAGNSDPTPTGMVDFKEGTTTLQAGVALVNGAATFSSTTLPIGVHSITAVYSGDSTYPGSTSSTGTVTIVAPPVADFTFTIANGQLIVPKGLPASTTTVNVTMTNGFNATVSFSCSGLPAGSLCSFSPSTLSKTGSSTLTVQINTSSAAVHTPLSGMEAAGGVMACGLLALPFFLRRKTRSAVRKAASLMTLLLLAGGLAVISGCGSGSTTTPTGTSTVTVTATGGNMTHTATFDIVVQ